MKINNKIKTQHSHSKKKFNKLQDDIFITRVNAQINEILQWHQLYPTLQTEKKA